MGRRFILDRRKSTFLINGGYERMGFLAICASLVVSLIILGCVISNHRELQRSIASSKRQHLVRILPKVSLEEHVYTNLLQFCLRTVEEIEHDPNFAYLVILDSEGLLSEQIVRPGIKLPDVERTLDPGIWYLQRTVADKGFDDPIEEFSAPLFKRGELAGVAVFGFTEPKFGLQELDGRYLAGLSLPVFLLGACFYIVFKRETQPVMKLSYLIHDALNDKADLKHLNISHFGPYRDLADQFNLLIKNYRQRSDAFEQVKITSIATEKAGVYRGERLETIIEKIPDGILIMDQTGRGIYANRRIHGVIGIPCDQIIGHTLQEWCCDEPLIEHLHQFMGSNLCPHRTETMEFQPTKLVNRTVAVTSRALASHEESFQPHGTLFIFRDITAERIGKAVQEEFITQVSHELKTPINNISMYSEMLLDKGLEDKDFQVEAINTIHDEAERSATLVNSLMSIYKIEMGSLPIERQRVRISEMLQDTFEAIAHTGRCNDLKFKLDLPAEMSPLFVDKDLLRTAINNLLTNAVKYNRPGGEVSLVAEETEQTISLRVRDSGLGIAPEEREKVFEKFYRSERDEIRQKPGHGLGLALTSSIVEIHNGQLYVESELGQWSEFIIKLEKHHVPMEGSL